MSINSILTRRILASILFLASTFGVILFLPHNPIIQRLWVGNSDTAVYALIIFLMLIIVLALIGLLISQNIHFVITSKDQDERSQTIKKDIILKSFSGIFIILIVWFRAQYLFTFDSIFAISGTYRLARDMYWNGLGGYFVLVPIMIFPFVVALWNDTETKLINPFLNYENFIISSSQIILVPLIIGYTFGSVAISDLQMSYPIEYYMENKSEISLLGDSNFEIIINPQEPEMVTSNNATQFYKGQITTVGLEESQKSNTQIQNSILINTYYQWDLTQKIFGTPDIKIYIKDLKSLKLTNTKSVIVRTTDGKCLDKNNLKLILEGNNFRNLELPCNAKPQDFKNLEDLRFNLRY